MLRSMEPERYPSMSVRQLWIALIGVALVGAAAPTSPPRAGMHAEVTTVRGPVAALDVTSSPATMQVSERGRSRMIRFDPDDVRVLERGRPVSLRALRVGQFVEVRQAAWGGRHITQSIEILRPGRVVESSGSVRR